MSLLVQRAVEVEPKSTFCDSLTASGYATSFAQLLSAFSFEEETLEEETTSLVETPVAVVDPTPAIVEAAPAESEESTLGLDTLFEEATAEATEEEEEEIPWEVPEDDPEDPEYDYDYEYEEEKWNKKNFNSKSGVMALRRKQSNKKEKISKRFVNACRAAHETELRKIYFAEIDAKKANSRVRVTKEIAKRNDDNQLARARYASLLSYKRNAQHLGADAALAVTLTAEQIQELQNRELTPEDYELLLLLDASVPKKTVSTSLIDKWETVVLTEVVVGEVCCVCLSDYGVGDKVKVLPCGHKFHKDCIETWLTTASVNCPADGLPLVD